MGRSILDDLGQEVTGIAAPVSICMALTVILVRVLNPEGESDSGAVYLASVYYSEEVRKRRRGVAWLQTL
jgi:presenilin 1